ncbi:MAG: aspartate kinase [Bacteroidales bacterium]|nr:aspartate kinase [Bacteroidales bacterium]
MYKIYVEKFGGASVNSALAVENVANILKGEIKKQEHNAKRVIVISAMGKTTNMLETLVNSWYYDKVFDEKIFDKILEFHYDIIEKLFKDQAQNCLGKINLLFNEIKNKLLHASSSDYNFVYDQIVSFGERISTNIVSEYLNHSGLKNKLVSALDIVKTDNNYRDANVDWKSTKTAVEEWLLPIMEYYDIVITQGFIGGTKENLTTTLSREGSDYSAAIISYSLKAENMTIWKDVPGLLNADPKRIENTTKLLRVPYKEAIELSYYGATIIHPKTIKPLENLSIPLYIKSFIDPEQEPTVICSDKELFPIVPNYIFKDNQLLLSISPKDFSFIAERNIAYIFEILAKHNVKVNLMQNSAISFSVCIDENLKTLPLLLEELSQWYKVRYNTSLQLVTIRHYNKQAIDNILKGRQSIIEQKNRTTVQFLINM